MLSFIVPAHNEQACLAVTLQAIHESARAVERPYEIIVVNDASTDATSRIAEQHDARVVHVNHRQIAATRNSGGHAARGEYLFFVDADTTINSPAVAAAVRAMDKNAAGGGALARFDSAAPLYAHVLLFWFGFFMRLAGMTGGAFLFCKRAAFQAVGGFDEKLFGAEDAVFAWALKRQGRFVVIWPSVLTSSRRMRGLRGLRMTLSLVCMGFFPKMLTKRSRVRKIWYESNREQDVQVGESPGFRIFNTVLLLILLTWLTSPLWMLVPWAWTPPGSALEKLRLSIGVFSCHVGLVLWPCTYFLARNLFRQTRWLERLRILALITLCVCLGWGATQVVFWSWAQAVRWAISV